jgi:threonine dehydrogenase-like Zn-dependent dehydrogenase
VLVRTLACGICGSDLHRAAASRHDDQPCLILGHEFCAEILGYGPHTDGPIPIGGRVVSFPYIEGPKGLEVLGFTPDYPGGFSDRMVLGIDDLVAVPNGLSPTLAALTEPMAVGEHAVALATPAPGDVAMVIGCGPVGLAVILALRRRGTDPIIAVDFSPQRRLLAERIGADMTIDPKRESPYDSWGKFGIDGQDALALLAYAARKTPKRSLIFDCVGAPGIIGSIVNGAPLGATVVVVGACAQEDRFIPLRALTKELQLRFANAYTHDEFAMTLRRIADGGLDPSPILTREIGIEDIDDAFAALASPEEAKIVIRHR